MNMVMKYGLPGGRAVGLQNPYTVRSDRGLDSAGHQPGAQSDRGEAWFVNVQNVNPVFPGDHQHMPFAGRVNVHESNGKGVLMNFVGWSYVIGNFTENTLILRLHQSAAPSGKVYSDDFIPFPWRFKVIPYTRHLLYYRHITRLSADLNTSIGGAI